MPRGSRPFHGVRLESAPTTLDELCRAYLQRAGSDEFFSHATAAVLLGLPVPKQLLLDRVLDVSVLAPAHPPQAAGVHGHRLQYGQVIRRGGLPVAHPADTWVQLAEHLSTEQLVVVGDALVRRRHPHASLDELHARLADARGQRGIRRLRDAAKLVRPGTDSPQESRMRLLLVRAGLPEPTVGHTVIHEGYFVGTPDLAYPEQLIALEYEGDGHRTDTRVFRDDIERHELFRDAGWHPIRVTADHLVNPHRLVDRVARALAARSSRGK